MQKKKKRKKEKKKEERQNEKATKTFDWQKIEKESLRTFVFEIGSNNENKRNLSNTTILKGIMFIQNQLLISGLLRHGGC